MSAGKHPKKKFQELSFDSMVSSLRSTMAGFPDKRTGSNCHYSIETAALGAFSVFFTQSPSFLAFQTTMLKHTGISNAQTLFDMDEIPSDNHIRNLMDEVAPSNVYPVFHYIFNGIKDSGQLNSFRSYDNHLLCALDGTYFFSSDNIQCKNCSSKKHKDGTTTYFHSAITPVLVAPGQKKVISLPPEFITPQDGHNKQDCENAAAKRWITEYAPVYRDPGMIILGDDLYCRQPICKLILDSGLHFILVCKPDSHKILYQWIEELQAMEAIETLVDKIRRGNTYHIYTYRFVNRVPVRDGEDALEVNWCELTVTSAAGKRLYKNAFATDFTLSKDNVKQIVADGRARWKIENENNNILKTKGYHLEHNFGHGKNHLSNFLLTLNLLAFLFHTALEMFDDTYRRIREDLPARKTFFDDIRALTRYMCFTSWEVMLTFMARGLKLELPDES